MSNSFCSAVLCQSPQAAGWHSSCQLFRHSSDSEDAIEASPEGLSRQFAAGDKLASRRGDMERKVPDKGAVTAVEHARSAEPSNGRTVGPEGHSPDLSVLLAGLQTMRDGDFSVRLPIGWTGLAGKIADTFND